LSNHELGSKRNVSLVFRRSENSACALRDLLRQQDHTVFAILPAEQLALGIEGTDGLSAISISDYEKFMRKANAVKRPLRIEDIKSDRYRNITVSRTCRTLGKRKSGHQIARTSTIRSV
jgi:hypothetical protein